MPAVQSHAHPGSEAPADRFDDEAQFLAANEAAMGKMMADMAAAPTGDIDRDFVAMMVPHHQGAIDMAQIILRYGKNEQLKRLAQEIIVTQQQEIAAMKLAVGDPLPPSIASPTQPASGAAAPRCVEQRYALAPRPLARGDHSDEPQLSSVREPDRYRALRDHAGLRRTGPRCRNRSGHRGQPSRQGLRRRAILQHRFGDRPDRQQAPRRDPPRRPAARQFQPALQGAGSRPRHGFLARPQDDRGRLDRQQFRHLHRHRDQRRQAHDLCRPLASRSLLHAGRQGGLGDGARRGLCGGARRTRASRKKRGSRSLPAPACRSSRRTASTATSARRSTRRPSSSPSPTMPSSAGSLRRVRSAPIIAATPDGSQVWFTLKDTGKTQVFDATPAVRAAQDHGHRPASPITSTSCAMPTARSPMSPSAAATRSKSSAPTDFSASGDDPGRQAPARRLAVGRRQPRLCRPGERRRARRDRHR